MVYHVRITRKTGGFWSREIVILDLSRTELMDDIVNHYHSGQKFTVEGRVIDPFDIESIRITETMDDSTVLIPQIKIRRDAERAENRRRRRIVVSGRTDRWYVSEEGNNVTNQFIRHPPQRSKKQG